MEEEGEVFRGGDCRGKLMEEEGEVIIGGDCWGN